MNDARDSHPVREVISQIVDSKSINPEQVDRLEKFVAEDWVIDQDEVHLLFRINQSIGPKDEDCPSWTKFFISSVSRLVVMDMNTPGQIDEAEGNLLAELLDQYATANETENQLLWDLRNTTSSIGGKLADRIQSFE